MGLFSILIRRRSGSRSKPRCSSQAERSGFTLSIKRPCHLVGANGIEFTGDPLEAGIVRIVGNDQAAG